VALGIAEKPSQLYRRVTMLIQESPVPRNLSRLRSVAVFSLSFLLLGVVSTVRLDAEDRTQKETPTQEKAKEKTEAKKTETPAKAESYTYTGLVRTVGTLKPIEGATVTVRRSTTGSVSRGEKEELIQETKHKTDKDGKYTFTIPPEQSSLYTLYIELDVSAPNHATKSGFGYSFTMIRQNEKTGERPFFEDVRLRPAKEITGLVETPEGKPAKSVRVLCFSTSSGGPFNAEGEYEFGSFDETFTDANGKFTLNAITPGEFVYWVLPKDYAPSTHALKKDQRGDIGKVILQEGIRMKGKAVDTEGKPIPNIYIAAENANGNELLNNLAVADSIRRVTKTNEKGEFEFLPLPPSKYRIQPSERDYEPSESHKGRSPKLPLEHVFLPQKVTIKEGEKPDPIEVRAHPFVLLEAQFLNAQGKPSGGHAPHFTGRIDGEFWSSEMKPEKGGKMTLKVPHGLENAQLSFIDNEHNSVRFRKSKDDTLNHGYSLDLGTMDRDVKTIEVIRYIAPTLVLNIKTKDGTKLNAKEVGITGWYMKHEKMRGIGFTSKGRPTEMNFQRQDDGKFRTSQMLPDEEMTVTVFHDEYKDSVFKVSLKEGETKEMEVELEKK
jgi:protocatechuate 3,4-dioxygenase beta subunit